MAARPSFVEGGSSGLVTEPCVCHCPLPLPSSLSLSRPPPPIPFACISLLLTSDSRGSAVRVTSHLGNGGRPPRPDASPQQQDHDAASILVQQADRAMRGASHFASNASRNCIPSAKKLWTAARNERHGGKMAADAGSRKGSSCRSPSELFGLRWAVSGGTVTPQWAVRPPSAGFDVVVAARS